MRPFIIAAVVALIQLGILPVGHAQSGSRPNIVFIMADDMGWAQPGFNGGNPALTPNMDALADEGMRLSDFYTHSVCAPTRAALLTGRYAFRTWSDWRTEDFGKPSYLAKLGLTLAHNDRGEPTRRIHALDTEERTIAEALRDAGYFTSLIGKWHLGEWLPGHLPMGQGFEHQYGHYAWGIDYYNKTIVHNAPARFAVYDWHRNQQPIHETGYATDLIAAEADRVIAARKNDDRPFFVYVAFNAVHGPLNPPPGFSGDPDDSMAIRDAMLSSLDNAVGRIERSIDQHGFRNNTLLVLCNDNGPVLEELSRPFRGTKNTTYEGGVRQPAILRWPGHTEPGTTKSGLMFIADFFPTFITLANGNHQQDRPIDGIDMTSMLFAGQESPRQEIIYDVTGSVRLPTIRRGDFKLMGDVLYNIAKDPGEQTDVADKHPGVVQDLKQRLDKAASERPPLGDKPLLMDPPLPYVYGLDEQTNVPDWLVTAVDAVRATQPTEWAPGETPWPKAPLGADASKMDGLKDELTK
ncbi:arylsulfatase B [Rubripirellula reticaptiva]|uniref:Arylsulfatase n=1 Tax=Rubripirellula reticaptiva TaxID=2528013 RepID=A0A5C6F4H0_9BACT|nr:arylsulfatase [Rubripirellula reticaptiva]TWU56248.1 Arylsulfatase precursor [Rubripirellula reticaptiva]